MEAGALPSIRGVVRANRTIVSGCRSSTAMSSTKVARRDESRPMAASRWASRRETSGLVDRAVYLRTMALESGADMVLLAPAPALGGPGGAARRWLGCEAIAT